MCVLSLLFSSFLFRLFRFFISSASSVSSASSSSFLLPLSLSLSLASYPPFPLFSHPLLPSLLCFLFFFCPCRFYRFFHLFSPLFLPLLSSLPLLSLFAPFAPFPSSVLWLFLLLSPLSFSSVQKPGQFCLLLVFIPADVSTFYLFCPKARSILGCLSQPPD